nr:MAG TPA: Helix-turn-helix XRE-family like protein [Caudoviricetes sp.]
MNKKYNVFPKLIECRELLGYTQADMAEVVGVGRETYKKHERGEFDFRLMEMLAIQEAINDNLQTNLTLDELFKMEKSFKCVVWKF